MSLLCCFASLHIDGGAFLCHQAEQGDAPSEAQNEPKPAPAENGVSHPTSLTPKPSTQVAPSQPAPGETWTLCGQKLHLSHPVGVPRFEQLEQRSSCLYLLFEWDGACRQVCLESKGLGYGLGPVQKFPLLLKP